MALLTGNQDVWGRGQCYALCRDYCCIMLAASMYIAVFAILSECYHTAAAANCCKPVIGIFKCEELLNEAPVLGIEKKLLESSSKS